MANWACGKRNLDGLDFPLVDGVEYAISEFTDCLIALMHSGGKGAAPGYDIQDVYVMDDYAKKKLSGEILYRWKPTKRDLEGNLHCPLIRVFFWYYKGKIIVLQPQTRHAVYERDNIYALVQEAMSWKRSIDQKELSS